MREISRRSILAGAAAIPAAVAVPAIPAIASAADPDAGLKTLFDKLGAAIDAWQKYVNGPQKEAAARYAKLMRRRPRTTSFPKCRPSL